MTKFTQELVNGLTQGGLYALVALGYSMLYGVLKLLNFAHGDLYMVGAFVGYFVLQWFGGPTALVAPVPIVIFSMEGRASELLKSEELKRAYLGR